MDERCQSCSSSAEQETCFFPCPRSRRRTWSRKTGSAASSRVGLLISILRLKSGAYSRNSSRFPRWCPHSSNMILYRQSPSGQKSRINNWDNTQLRTDGVPCRESAGTGPAILKVGPSNGCCLFRFHHGSLLMRLSFPTPTIY